MTSLLKAIYEYRAAWNGYLAASLDDDDAPLTYKPALKVVEDWNTAAVDKGEATEAVRLALEFYEIGDSEVIPAMMRAALGFMTRPPTHDPLLDAIADYQAAFADFNAKAPGDDAANEAFADVTFRPCMKILEAWQLPATTTEGAVAALELVSSELKDFASSDMVRPLVGAALGYLKGGEVSA